MTNNKTFCVDIRISSKHKALGCYVSKWIINHIGLIRSYSRYDDWYYNQNQNHKLLIHCYEFTSMIVIAQSTISLLTSCNLALYVIRYSIICCPLFEQRYRISKIPENLQP